MTLVWTVLICSLGKFSCSSVGCLTASYATDWVSELGVVEAASVIDLEVTVEVVVRLRAWAASMWLDYLSGIDWSVEAVGCSGRDCGCTAANS